MRILAALIGVLAVVTPASGQPDSLTARFEAANEAYAQGRYERAVTRYRQIVEDGYESGALYHNLGNAHVRLDRVGPAIWAYEKALRLRPDDPRIQHNLEYVRLEAGLPVDGLPARGIQALGAGNAPLVLFGLGWLLLSAGVFFAVYGAGADQMFAWRHPGAWGPVVVGLLIAVAAFGTSYVQAHDSRAVVVVEEAALRPTLDGEATPGTTVPGGSMVEVQTRRDSLLRVQLRDGTVGWMSMEAVRPMS